jgi:ATP-dependent exoDNAse (exonuclease V) alpha subunit
MIKNHIINLIQERLDFDLTKDQNHLIELIANFVLKLDIDDNELYTLLVKGYAGTGKTTVLSAFVKALKKLKFKFVLLAPTGRAAKVFSSYSGFNAYTIHKKIYRQKSSKDGFGNFVLDKNLHKKTIFIVDEASMISNHSFESSIFGSGNLLIDLMEYVFSGEKCQLILVGDTAQLPPVGLDVSPALHIQTLQEEGLNVAEIELTQVVRQSLDSGILSNASNLRQNIAIETTDYTPKIELSNFKDIEYLNGAELIEKISDSYDKFGMDNCLVITRSNKRANKFNEGIRQSILWRESELSVGDYLMVVKNNYFWIKDNEKIDFIANGDIVEIVRINKIEELYNHRFADVTVKFIDYEDFEVDVKLFLDTLTLDTASFDGEQNKELFYTVLNDYLKLKGKKQQYKAVKENPHFNALQVKFAYAVTCHKAQGGQWNTVFIDHGYLTDEMINKEYLRWLYTAFTRASKKLYLVNFKKEFILDFESIY